MEVKEFFMETVRDSIKPKLGYDASRDYDAWRAEVRERFIELLGLDLIAENACDDPQLDIEFEEKKDGYTLTRFTFASEKGAVVPCYLLIPDTGAESYPVAITLQGHSTGFHNSIGEIKFERDKDYQPRGSFGLQAVKHGFATLCIEQRGMGERRPKDPEGTQKWRDKAPGCDFSSMPSLMMGRTVIGERVWDVSRAIDLLARFPKCDTGNIVLTGNSGGGTATYYTACYDERIKYAVPSCAFCPYPESILDIHHCSCNYIPSALRYFDMQDLSCLIAPRKMAIVSGENDLIFPLYGVKRGYETVKAVYEAAGVPDNCRLVVTPKGHWWCEDIIWGTVKEIMD